MSWLTETLAEMHNESRLLYAFVTVGVVVGVGLIFGLLGYWITHKLGIDTSRLNHK